MCVYVCVCVCMCVSTSTCVNDHMCVLGERVKGVGRGQWNGSNGWVSGCACACRHSLYSVCTSEHACACMLSV